MSFTLKQQLGVLAFDLPRYAWWLNRSWIRVCNRNELLLAAPQHRGVACQWRWTSDLHATKVFSWLGTCLMKRAIGEWPITFAEEQREREDLPKISFIIGHRGSDRIPHLKATLATIAAQRGVACECIVVEQSAISDVRGLLPGWVRHVQTPPPAADMPYCRSWTLNVGARHARGTLLVLHDNDMLVPEAYAAELWARYTEGYEVINLKRFIFYLSEQHSHRVFASGNMGTDELVDTVVQNAEAGGSVAIGREAFLAIGGFDEAFVGWGGEDNEFWERAQTRRVWPYGYFPIVHLWHAPQPEKAKQNPITAHQFREFSCTSPQSRIADLVQRKFGDVRRMDPEWLPKDTKP